MRRLALILTLFLIASPLAAGTVVQGSGAWFWDDIQVPGFGLRSGASAPDFEQWDAMAPIFVYTFGPSTDEMLYGSIQMPHSWAGTSIECHVHWVPKVVSDGNPANQKPIWCLDYTWADYATVFPADANVCTSSITPSEEPAVNKHYMAPFAAISPGTGADAGSSILVFRLYRDADAAGDTYESDAIFLSFDCHYQSNKFGSSTEIPD